MLTNYSICSTCESEVYKIINGRRCHNPIADSMFPPCCEARQAFESNNILYIACIGYEKLDSHQIGIVNLATSLSSVYKWTGNEVGRCGLMWESMFYSLLVGRQRVR